MARAGPTHVLQKGQQPSTSSLRPLTDTPSVIPPAHEDSADVDTVRMQQMDEDPSKLKVESAVEVKHEQSDGDRMPPRLLQLQVCALVFLAGLDMVLLHCCFLALRMDLGLSLGELSTLQVVQSVGATLSAPVWAALADGTHVSRKRILIVGAIGQGIVSLLLGFVTWWGPMIALRALNGMMLSSLKPLVDGIVADHTSKLRRGRMYGRVILAMHAGSFFGTLVGTPMSTSLFFGGLQGWRVVFGLSGLLGVVAGGWVAVSMDLPRREKSSKGQDVNACLIRKETKRLARFLRIPTFDVLILTGIFGTVGMSAGGFKTLYFQMVGIDDALAGTISSCGTVAVGLGVLLGGCIGDFFAARCKHHGRALTAQISIAMGIPLEFLMLWGIAPFNGNLAWYIVLTCLHGVFATWPLTAAKLPLLSELVPEEDRPSLMAWDGTLEHLSGTLLGGPMVAFIASTFFGFDEADVETGKSSVNAQALGHASTVMICGPLTVCLFCWFLLHWSYPKDLDRIAREGEPKSPCDVGPPCAGANLELSSV